MCWRARKEAIRESNRGLVLPGGLLFANRRRHHHGRHFDGNGLTPRWGGIATRWL